ncbi:hypothetical protein FACS189456_3700 [Bacteroidia bacterium]|nr:hypothetical protein FACS189456_3700 [Bacteroidia bacterium]
MWKEINTISFLNSMLIERIDNRIMLNVSSGVNFYNIQRLIDYAKYLEATAKSTATAADVAQLSNDVTGNWWAKNKNRFVVCS